MMRFMKLLLFTITCLFVLSACNEGEAALEEEAAPEVEQKAAKSSDNAESNEDKETVDRDDWPNTIRFAVDGIDGMEELQRRYDVFQQKISDLMGVEFDFFALSDRTVSITAMEYDQVDVILGSPAEYVLMKSAVPGIEPLAAIERSKYHSVFIVPANSELQTLDDLKGKKISMKEIGSGSGHIGPSSILIEAGFNLDNDVEIQFLGGASVEALKAGEVDALADGVKVYDKLVEEDGEGVWRLLHEGPPLPQDPFVASPNLPDSFKAELKRVLLEHQDEILESILFYEDNDKYKKAKIVDINDSDFDLMRDTYEMLGIDL